MSANIPKAKKYRKDKPWDSADIDHWKIEQVTRDKPLPPPLEESSFATLFPKYREEYIRSHWSQIKQVLSNHGIKAELDLHEGSMSVFTTKKTWDPCAILNARDYIKLIARSVPLPNAKTIFNDGVYCDIIKISGMVRNKERFAKRRQRILGPNGATLKALELLTECYIMIQGGTVSAIGDTKNLKAVRRVVEDCMRNVHPIYNIKTLMIKRELAKNKEMAGEDWHRFLPNFKKIRTNCARKKGKKIGKANGGSEIKSPFPPAQTMRKIDLQIESGEYFMGKDSLLVKEREKRRERMKAKRKRKREEYLEEFVPPSEDEK